MFLHLHPSLLLRALYLVVRLWKWQTQSAVTPDLAAIGTVQTVRHAGSLTQIAQAHKCIVLYSLFLMRRIVRGLFIAEGIAASATNPGSEGTRVKQKCCVGTTCSVLYAQSCMYNLYLSNSIVYGSHSGGCFSLSCQLVADADSVA